MFILLKCPAQKWRLSSATGKVTGSRTMRSTEDCRRRFREGKNKRSHRSSKDEKGRRVETTAGSSEAEAGSGQESKVDRTEESENRGAETTTKVRIEVEQQQEEESRIGGPLLSSKTRRAGYPLIREKSARRQVK